MSQYTVAPLSKLDAVAVRRGADTAVFIAPQVPEWARQPAAEHVHTVACAARGRCAATTLPAGRARELAANVEPPLPAAFRWPVLPRLRMPAQPIAASTLVFFTALPVGGAAAAGWHALRPAADPEPPVVAGPAAPVPDQWWPREHPDVEWPDEQPRAERHVAGPRESQPRQSTSTGGAPSLASAAIHRAPVVGLESERVSVRSGELPVVPDETPEVTVPVPEAPDVVPEVPDVVPEQPDGRTLPDEALQLPISTPALDEAADRAREVVESGELPSELDELVDVDQAHEEADEDGGEDGEESNDSDDDGEDDDS